MNEEWVGEVSYSADVRRGPGSRPASIYHTLSPCLSEAHCRSVRYWYVDIIRLQRERPTSYIRKLLHNYTSGLTKRTVHLLALISPLSSTHEGTLLPRGGL